MSLMMWIGRRTEPCLVHDRAFNGLANPPGGVSGKPEAPFRIEFLDGVNQAEIAFFNQVQQRQTAVQV